MSINIKVFYDYNCPFSYISLAMLERYRQQLDLDVQLIGIESHANIPPRGGRIKDTLRSSNEDIKASFEFIEATSKQYNIPYKKVSFIPNTKLAHIATQFVKDKDLEYPFHNSIMNAYFARNMNIGDKRALLRIAGQLGIDPKEFEQSLNDEKYKSKFQQNHELASQYNINTTPTFVVNNKHKFYGMLDFEELRRFVENMS